MSISDDQPINVGNLKAVAGKLDTRLKAVETAVGGGFLPR